MITAFFVATAQGNAHRALGPEPSVPERQLAQWLVLGKAQLKPGQILLKIARHRYQDRIYTWIGLYCYAAELDTGRNHGSYAGAGLLACEVAVLGAEAITTITEIQKYLLKHAVRNEKFIGTLDQLRDPGHWSRLDHLGHSAVRAEYGLRPAGERLAERDLFIYLDPGAPEATRAAGQCIDWAQNSSYCAGCEELYLSVRGVDEPPLGTQAKPFSLVASEIASEQEREAQRAVEDTVPVRAATALPLRPTQFPSQSRPEAASLAGIEAVFEPDAARALLAISEELQAIRALLEGSGGPQRAKQERAEGEWGTPIGGRRLGAWALAITVLIVAAAAGFYQWSSRTNAPESKTAPPPVTSPSQPSTSASAIRPEDGARALAGTYYDAIAEDRIDEAASLRGLSPEARATLARQRGAFLYYTAGDFVMAESRGGRVTLTAPLTGILPDGSTRSGRTVMTLERGDGEDGWRIVRVLESPRAMALLP